MNSSIAKHLPGDPVFEGAPFVLRTAQPPHLGDHVTSRPQFSYREPLIGWSTYLASLGQHPLYFVEFSCPASYPSKESNTVTREEIIPDGLDKATQRRKQQLLNKLEACDAFLYELDLTLGILFRLEITGQLPSINPVPYPFDDEDFVMHAVRLGQGATEKNLTTLFVYATRVLLEMQDEKKTEEFKDLEERFGFGGYAICQVYGLTDWNAEDN
ncbi:uncharacterized protein I206_107168 [Kwoniella pini CBS 10737]|uniref:Uncharacterized protein n=1 Tax=Kwoniella pini CBS 10737 TaxID=1296096 RepID=A0A1B9HYZ1_9TREE|nr:uncharacterized protein I206_05286 [Kwoniella pini CBS 10737]OCF48507.1 hypothetical protein I206_05286 [Kwoniella pini CBS 10737]